MQTKPSHLLLVAASLVFVLLMVSNVAHGDDDPPPPGVEQILPRGQIAAVFEPRFVPAAGAKISDEAWVLGIVIEGEAKAYSLNLLNRHEIVNDRFGDLPVAAVW